TAVTRVRIPYALPNLNQQLTAFLIAATGLFAPQVYGPAEGATACNRRSSSEDAIAWSSTPRRARIGRARPPASPPLRECDEPRRKDLCGYRSPATTLSRSVCRCGS